MDINSNSIMCGGAFRSATFSTQYGCMHMTTPHRYPIAPQK